MNQGMSQLGKGQQAAGLGALAQPASMPKGKSPDSMYQIMELARKMSDAQLADVMAGKSMDVPQYVAMTEAMGRKKLRIAMQGAQAQQQAQQPSIKDRLMSEQQQLAQAPQMGGIAGIPAPNMESVDMAAGGIVAFADGDLVEAQNIDGMAYLSGQDPESLMKDQLRVEELLTKKKLAEEKERFEFLKKSAPDVAAKMAKENPSLVTPDVTTAPASTASKGAPASAKPTAPRTEVTGVGVPSKASGYKIPTLEELRGKKSEDYLSKLEGVSEKRRAGLAELKKQGGGEALMNLSAALLSSPTLAQGLAKGMPLVASAAASTRKEARAIENAADEYDLNIAKAREAAEKGDMTLALQYQQLANQAEANANLAKYQQGMLGVYGERAGAIAGKGKTISPDAALKQYNDMLKEPLTGKKFQQKFPNFQSYYQSLSDSTMGAPGLDLAAAARAEMERRRAQ
jgi:hypothetical protein